MAEPARTDAEAMAKQAGVDPKQFRARLRDQRFPWHDHYDRWEVVVGSPEYDAMKRVLDGMK